MIDNMHSTRVALTLDMRIGPTERIDGYIYLLRGERYWILTGANAEGSASVRVASVVIAGIDVVAVPSFVDDPGCLPVMRNAFKRAGLTSENQIVLASELSSIMPKWLSFMATTIGETVRQPLFTETARIYVSFCNNSDQEVRFQTTWEGAYFTAPDDVERVSVIDWVEERRVRV